MGFFCICRIMTLEEILLSVVGDAGFELWGYQYINHGKQDILRVYIEHENGILIENCQRVSRQLNAVLEVEEPIQGEYVLEVSSPGLERPLFNLEQFGRFIGKKVKIVLRKQLNGQRKWLGELKHVEGETVILNIDEQEVLLPFGMIEKANLVF